MLRDKTTNQRAPNTSRETRLFLICVMKNACLPLCLFLISLSTAAFTLIDWVPFTIDNVAVQLPMRAVEVDLSKQGAGSSYQNTRVFLAQDEYSTYQVIREDYRSNAKLGQGKAARKELYDGIIIGLLRSQKGTLVATSRFATAGGSGIEIKYKGLQLGTNRMAVKYTRALPVGKINYSFNFVPKDKQDATGSSGNEQRRRFFDSIVVKTNNLPSK